MSQGGTGWRVCAAIALTTGLSWAQSSALPASEVFNFRHLGTSSIDSQLAGPASGRMSAVWYSPDGSTLFARTASGQVFQTADFENWSRIGATRSEAVVRPESPPVSLPGHRQSDVITASGDAGRFWMLGHNLSVSQDSGVTWTTVAGTGEPVIGSGQHDVAVNPRDPSALAVANDFGIWLSRDNGQSWSGLNENLPNLPVARILSTARGAFEIALEDGRVLELVDARGPWTELTGDSAQADQDNEKQRLTRFLGAEITAFSRSGEYAYAGSSDGRIWLSRDHGASWGLSQNAGRGAVIRIFVDPDAPRSALAVLSGTLLSGAVLPATAARVVRTVNFGAVWDDVTGNLAEINVRGITADRLSGMAYAATDRGVYFAHLDLNTFSPVSTWQPLPGPLPSPKVVDVALGNGGRQLFVALEGYGLYTAVVANRGSALRLINTADFSTRPAAPGSLVSVIGGRVTSARAGDLRFPILAGADSESQLQVPFEARSSSVDLAIESSTRTTSLPLAIRNVSPAVFVDPDGSPFLVDADSGLALDARSAAHPRSRLQLMATGLGRVQPDWQTGVPAPLQNPPAVMATVRAFLDGIPVEVTKATLAPGYIGYYLVEIELPSLLNAGPAELYLLVDGQESNKVRVQVDSDAAATE